MKIFVTGATGVLGRATIPLLKLNGHTVRAFSRSDQNCADIRAMGAEPVRGSLYDPAFLAGAVTGCGAIIHMATSMPKMADLRSKTAWAENDLIRDAGTKAILKAAKDDKIRTVIFPSVALQYADFGDSWIDELSRIEPTGPTNTAVLAEKQVMDFASQHSENRGIVLRLAALYGPSSNDSIDMIDMADKGFAISVSPKDAYRSFLWIDDAATAILAALRGARSGIYNVAEETPSRQKHSLSAMANAVGRKRLMGSPSYISQFLLPRDLREIVSRSQRISSKKFSAETGWRSSIQSQMDGWSVIAKSRAPRKKRAA